MKYQKVINLLVDAPNKPSKLSSKNWVEINFDSHGTFNTNSQIKSKTQMLKSSLCHYSYAYILVKRTISVVNTTGACAAANNGNKKVIFKNCVPFTDWIRKINNTQIDHTKNIDAYL